MTTCLIVDDSSLVRKLNHSMLTGFGFDCREAVNGRAALEACAEFMPDLILLDWNMPEMDGIEFLNHLRANPPPVLPKIIFCSTHNELAQIQMALDAGADEYIMKPFDNEILKGKLIQLGFLPS